MASAPLPVMGVVDNLGQWCVCVFGQIWAKLVDKHVQSLNVF